MCVLILFFGTDLALRWASSSEWMRRFALEKAAAATGREVRLKAMSASLMGVKLDGLEVARIMRKINTDSVLIFVTHMAQLAIKGYEVDALDFIVKPADQGSINYVLDKAMKRLEGVSNAAFALKTSDGIVSLSTNDIIYVEVFDHNLVYHTTKGNYDIRGRLSDVMKRLDPKRFIMCNRSYVVNLRYVSNINNDFLVVDGTQISISKSHRKEILQHFSNFLGENL